MSCASYRWEKPHCPVQGGNVSVYVSENHDSNRGLSDILYLWTQADSLSGTSEELLTPYLSAVTSGSEGDPQASCVDFSLFYTRRGGSKVSSPTSPRTLAVPGLTSAWTEIADQAAEDAESLFWDAVKILSRGEDDEIETFWPAAETPDDTSGDEW
jgi:hypothetical protein